MSPVYDPRSRTAAGPCCLRSSVVDIRDQLHLLERDLASLIITEEAECLQDLVLWAPVQDFVGKHLEGHFQASGATAIVVEI